MTSKHQLLVLLAAALAAASGWIAMRAYRAHCSAQRREFEEISRVQEVGAGLTDIAWSIREIRNMHAISNYSGLCAAHNASNPDGPELRTRGNPCPDELPHGTYYWLREWDRSVDSPETPLLWAFVPRQRVDYITLEGQKRVAWSNDFVKLTAPLSDRVVEVIAESGRGVTP